MVAQADAPQLAAQASHDTAPLALGHRGPRHGSSFIEDRSEVRVGGGLHRRHS
jgi:hypothetical protein